MEEKDLVRASKKGDEEAFASLVKKYRVKVFNLAFSLTRDRDTADDLAQEVFIKAYFALPRFELRSEFGTWLHPNLGDLARDCGLPSSQGQEIAQEKVGAFLKPKRRQL